MTGDSERDRGRSEPNRERDAVSAQGVFGRGPDEKHAAADGGEQREETGEAADGTTDDTDSDERGTGGVSAQGVFSRGGTAASR